MVDGLERELGERAQVIRLNVTSPLGRQAGARYQARFVPTFVVTDGRGNVVLNRGGRPSKQELLDAVLAAAAP
ncbi:MAG: hypothetical protein GXY76_12870 [Chloroflexi bacterium]|nr:hypothetical protein [Chloroflexota bacterium]